MYILNNMFNSIYDEELGYRPSSLSIKPAHIANGLVKNTLGKYYKITEIAKFLEQKNKFKKGGINPNRTAEKLISINNSPFESFSNHHEELNELREYAYKIVNADEAAYLHEDNPSFASLSFTSDLMITGDSSDRGLGSFIYSIIKKTELKNKIKEALESDKPQDPISILLWPLLVNRNQGIANSHKEYNFSSKQHHKSFLDFFAYATTNICSYEKNKINNLRFIQRIIHFCCMSVCIHAQYIGANGVQDKRKPFLLSTLAEKNNELSKASHESIINCFNFFEVWLAECLANRLENKKQLYEDVIINNVDFSNKKECSDFLTSIIKYKNFKPSQEDIEARLNDYNRYAQLFSNPYKIIAHTIKDTFIRERGSSGGNPTRYFLNLGGRIGLIFPFENKGRDSERLQPSVNILDTIVRSLVNSSERLISIDNFLDRLWDKFGIIVGGRKEDVDILSNNHIEIDNYQLTYNFENFIDVLEEMDLAKRFADNVTQIGLKNVD